MRVDSSRPGQACHSLAMVLVSAMVADHLPLPVAGRAVEMTRHCTWGQIGFQEEEVTRHLWVRMTGSFAMTHGPLFGATP